MPNNFTGIIFDMDGTLTVPALDFKKIRSELGILEGDLVEVIESWPQPKRQDAWDLIESHEAVAAAKMKFQPGVPEALAKFKDSGLKLGILTRNSLKSTRIVIATLGVKFDTVLTRDFHVIKPDPETVAHIIREWNVPPHEVLVVGDYIHDITCAQGAGAKACFYANSGMISYAEHADYTVESFAELEKLVLNAK